jgi:hypothetical protein
MRRGRGRRSSAGDPGGGDPTALVGGIAGLELTPPIANETLVTGTATEQAIFPVARTPIPPRRGSEAVPAVRVGTSTTAATPGTYTLAARIGNANTSPLFGACLGRPDAGRVGDGRAVAVLRHRLRPRRGHDGHGGRLVRVQPFGHDRRRRPGVGDGQRDLRRRLARRSTSR